MRDDPTPVHREPLWHKLFWSQKSDYARLERELNSFRVDLQFLDARTKKSDGALVEAVRSSMEDVQKTENDNKRDTPWSRAAHSEIENVRRYLDEEKNIEGGWMSLHAARRHAVYALSAEELQLQASMLRAESSKIPFWRGKEMEHLLTVKDEALTVHRVIAAMVLRDEYFSNQYHKIWLIGSQITILLICCGLGLILLIPLVFFSSTQCQDAFAPWGYQMVPAVLFFGLLGAAFSAAGSLMNADAASKVPERVANQFVTIARAFFGSGAGLAGYAFYQSKMLNFRFGDEAGPGGALAIAFLFGFGGEVLIAHVLGTLGSRQPEARK